MARQYDVVEVAHRIEDKVKLLEHGRAELQSKAEQKAKAISEYDKALAIEIIKIKDEGKFPATLIEKIAKGQCYKERAQSELAEAEYKLTITKMDAIQAELNGWQSINRFLSVTEGR
jgi:hypothetical protein